jgi:NAD+ synthase
MHLLELDLPALRRHLVRFLAESYHSAGFERAVLGLSGGLDSALAAALAAEALGPENVLGLLLPWKDSLPASRADAELVVRHLGIRSRVVEITPMVEAFAAGLAAPDALRLGNIMARVRMTVIFDAAAEIRALPLGTSNKSELLLGYGTWYGDLASAVNPLGDLYKTQVFALSRAMGLPEAVIAKPPSADLVPGQTDEADLGWSYELIDRILVRAVEQRRERQALLDEGFEAAAVDGILARVRRHHFKRLPPVIAKVSTRSIGEDWLYRRDSGR